MILQEYIKMPKGEQLNMDIGARFRSLGSKDDNVKVGSMVCFYEVINVKKGELVSGYEVSMVWERLV